jgi:hypothetical protein
VIATLDGVDQLTDNPRRRIEQERGAIRPLLEGFPPDRITIALMGFEEIKGHRLLAFAEDIERKLPRFLDDGMRSRVGFHTQDDQRRCESRLGDPIDRSCSHCPILAFSS